MAIKSIKAREILDSRGVPTLEVEAASKGYIVRALVPSGKSKGAREALEKRDGGERYFGMGVLTAVKNVNEIIAPALVGQDPANQKEIDKLLFELGGGEMKPKLGANATVGVSIAASKLGAAEKGVPVWKHIQEISGTSRAQLPYLFMNLINGGVHAGSRLPIQEYIIVPQLATLKESLRAGVEIFYSLDNVLEEAVGENYIPGAVGDEGGYVPRFDDLYGPFDALKKAIEKTGYEGKVKFAVDVAASVLLDKSIKASPLDYAENKYVLDSKNFNRKQFLDFYKNLVLKYPFLSIEDPYDENDVEGFKEITAELGDKVWIVADDLSTTNPLKIKEIISSKAANAMIVKPNQVGTITETLNAVNLARKAKWKMIVSQRSGDTEDSFISDFAVGIAAEGLKAGAPTRSERTAKYNRLLKIEEEMQE